MDYRTIPLSEYPFIVFADHNSDLIASAIKARTKGNYSHVMWMVAPGIVASQGFTTYSKIPIQNYMRPGNRLKFVGLQGISEKGRQAIVDSIEKKLKGPWWRKLYDYLGIVGQLTGLRWIQTPFFDFCSEDAPYHLQKSYMDFPGEFDLALAAAIVNLPKNGSPAIHDEYSKKFRDTCFPLLGKWQGDEDQST